MFPNAANDTKEEMKNFMNKNNNTCILISHKTTTKIFAELFRKHRARYVYYHISLLV